jgi:beta-glucosidase
VDQEVIVELRDEVFEPLVARLTLEEKVDLLTGQDVWSLRAIPKIGLRSIVMSDGPVGVRGPRWDERDPSCNFPSPTAVAASWSPDGVRAVGSGLGAEARRKGVDVVLAPTINLHRTPYGGRHFEAFSEDPILTSEMARAYVEGVQSHGVAATVKHYVANDSETDRFTVDVRVDERALRELYLLAFEGPVVGGGSWLVMSAYNSINGATASENRLLTTPLQDEWGFNGVVVSDWTAVRSVESARHPQDLAMPGPGGAWGAALLDAVRSGQVPERLIDRKIVRILRLAARVGALDGFGAPARADAPDVREVARTASADGMVLLSNRGLLPIGEPARIAVIGEGARVARTQGGGSATVIPDSVVSPLEGVRRRWPDAEVTWVRGAVVREGLAPLEPGSYTTPDGEPGILLRYLDADGSELRSERREATSFVWFEADTTASIADSVELAFRWVHGASGGHAGLGVAAHADVELCVDGVIADACALRTAPGDDPATAVLNPPWGVVKVPVTDEAVDVVARFRPAPGGMPDSLAIRVGLPPADLDRAELLEEAAKVAACADVAIVVVSTTNEVESEGFDRRSLALPGDQDSLVRAVAAANPRTVVVVNAGAPVLLPWRDDVAAVIAAWFPGQEFGLALADVLSGDREPGGRLPVTWPSDEAAVPVSAVMPTDGRLEYSEGIHIGYRAWLRAGRVPAYWFGHGLGYTTFDVTDLVATAAEPGAVSSSARVSNTGTRRGRCVVQVYAERVGASAVERPVRWLVGFASVTLDPGQSGIARIEIPRQRFAHWTSEGWAVEPGVFRLVAGLSVVDDRASAEITLAAQPLPQGAGSAQVTVR